MSYNYVEIMTDDASATSITPTVFTVSRPHFGLQLYSYIFSRFATLSLLTLAFPTFSLYLFLAPSLWFVKERVLFFAVEKRSRRFLKFVSK